MPQLAPYAFLSNEIIPTKDANIHVGSSAVLYGLSIYTVFFGAHTEEGMLAFRLPEHYERLVKSAKMIGLDDVEKCMSYEDFIHTIQNLTRKNSPSSDQFYRVTIHAADQVAGVRTKDLSLQMSIFLYDAENILPQDGAKLKTSLWRRVSDSAIPVRAKVNGAYVNSCLAKQDAIDAGCDDCLFLNDHGYICELSAANIFLIKGSTLITPDTSSDILEGITRRSIIELAQREGLQIDERKVALTEVYTADEVFATGTSSFVSPILEVDTRTIGNGAPGNITLELRDQLAHLQRTENDFTCCIH